MKSTKATMEFTIVAYCMLVLFPDPRYGTHTHTERERERERDRDRDRDRQRQTDRQRQRGRRIIPPKASIDI